MEIPLYRFSPAEYLNIARILTGDR